MIRGSFPNQTRSVWFEVELPYLYPDTVPVVSVKGGIVGDEQERWETILKQKFQELEDSV